MFGRLMGKYLWWQYGAIYQIYPRSFLDADGDGIGDLRGITAKLDYLQDLGVDAIWLAPIYPSPMVDFGYDVADYTAVHPAFGTMADFDRLIESAHARRIRVILDLVAANSSDEHPWFRESRSSRSSLKRDWYIWRDPAPGGGVPNNWLSEFGGPAWEFDAVTGQYYLHTFHRRQPDLNWRNPDVQETMLDVMRFWFDRGVNGFRVDVMWHLVKDAAFRNNPLNPLYDGSHPYRQLIPQYTEDQPEVHDVVAMMRSVADEYEERVIIGEVYLPVRQLVSYYGVDGRGAHLPFNFQLLTEPWQARRIERVIEEYERLLPAHAWPNWVLSNHDVRRVATRVGQDQARIAAMLLLTLRGTPTVYYGDELGMENAPLPEGQMQDPKAANMPGFGLGRDGSRTPMQWSRAPHAGFTTGEPWLPIAKDAATRNVESEQASETSMLSFTKRLLALRRTERALSTGAYRTIPASGNLLAYLREGDGRRFLVALNLGAERATLVPPKRIPIAGEVVEGTLPRRRRKLISGSIELEANEGLIALLD
jgi:alpha-glucosidase